MYRILIVEDNPGIRKHLEKLLFKGLPDSELVSVASIEEAQQEIADSHETGLRFDAAILDIIVPKNAEGAPEPDGSLRDLIWRLPWRTLIFRISASEEAIAKDKFVPQGPSQGSLTRLHFESKMDAGYTLRILRELRRDRIRRQMDAAFFGPMSDYVNYALHDLIRDIELFWYDLDKNDQEEILARFEISVDGNEVKAKLAARRGKPKTSANKQDPS